MWRVDFSLGEGSSPLVGLLPAGIRTVLPCVQTDHSSHQRVTVGFFCCCFVFLKPSRVRHNSFFILKVPCLYILLEGQIVKQTVNVTQHTVTLTVCIVSPSLYIYLCKTEFCFGTEMVLYHFSHNNLLQTFSMWVAPSSHAA